MSGKVTVNAELPTGWLAASFSDVAKARMGPTILAKDLSESGLPVYSAGKANTPWGFTKRDVPVFPNGTIVVSARGSIGFPKIPKEPSFTSTQTTIAITPSPAIGSTYLQRFLQSSDWAEMSSGAAIPMLTISMLGELAVPLAPPAEQKRIADKLEAVLGRVDACRARLDRVPALLKRFRQSVLAAATSGKLTEEWRKTCGVKDEWESVTLGSLMESKPRNGYSPKSVDFETPVRSLTLTATTSGRFRGEHSKFINEIIPASSHLWLVPGDILIQRANTIEYVGVSAIFDGPTGKYIYPDLMMKCRANARTNTGFLHLLLQSDRVRSHFRDNATGTAGNMPKINQGTVISASTTLPTLPEQQEIVRRVEALFAFADRIEARLDTAQKSIEHLTPATLAKAFRGELVPQDPKDEPASELLERIRQQKTSSK